MKESLTHLPRRKRQELCRITGIIRDMAPQNEMLILFGSHARGNWVQDVTIEARCDPAYKITPEELKYLAGCIELLRDQTQTSCDTKMKSWSEAET